MRENANQDKSGIFIGTHDGDTSVDSTPLLWNMIARSKAKNFTLYPAEEPTVLSNGLGVKAFFNKRDPNVKRAIDLYKTDPEAIRNAQAIYDDNRNLTGLKINPVDGEEFIVPVNSPDQVLAPTNRAIQRVNEKYGTNFPMATWATDEDGTPIPFDFGRRIVVPQPFGVLHKYGGRLNKGNKLMTKLF